MSKRRQDCKQYQSPWSGCHPSGLGGNTPSISGNRSTSHGAQGIKKNPEAISGERPDLGVNNARHLQSLGGNCYLDKISSRRLASCVDPKSLANILRHWIPLDAGRGARGTPAKYCVMKGISGVLSGFWRVRGRPSS